MPSTKGRLKWSDQIYITSKNPLSHNKCLYHKLPGKKKKMPYYESEKRQIQFKDIIQKRDILMSKIKSNQYAKKYCNYHYTKLNRNILEVII